MLRALLVASLALFSSSLALPGQPTTPQALGLTLTLRPGEAKKLVLLTGATVSNVEVYRSAAGRDHLTFTVTAQGETHPAIMYAGDWTAADQTRLRSGRASLVGLWATFADAPSLTVKRTLADTAAPRAAAPTKALLRITGAAIEAASVRTYRSAAGKTHLLYTFSVNGKAYQAVLYAGTWTDATAALLRTGRGTLYGTWGEYDGKPNFVTTRVEQ